MADPRLNQKEVERVRVEKPVTADSFRRNDVVRQYMDGLPVRSMKSGKLKERKRGHAEATTWRGDAASDPSGSDNLLTGVWALNSLKYSGPNAQRDMPLLRLQGGLKVSYAPCASERRTSNGPVRLSR
jgi:hypothetical protein